ncbi:hypothetical protein ABL78_2959 [Leptomonas seymouri]|uniref:CW-type domain-containing protein n=1 Tax=Leptomonas seymouri TaxID=5684 RepID=A0A0N1ILB1_LEPSE|nr:hypothetical protein ABL78_2959 [Leptomonas seymouri]|eukprot:KPI87968.1 hypothetical protein ABL78_2959 [Leptomonas seymouri]
MLNNADAIGAHHSDAVPRSAFAAAGEATEKGQIASAVAPSLMQTEPRYIRLPDVLYQLRHRYPTVTESVFLECTRCHQWVAVSVLLHIPDEVREGRVARSAQGLASIGERTSSHGPLRHAKQDDMHRREQLTLEALNIRWHSPRLLEKESQQHGASSGAGRGAGAAQNGSSNDINGGKSSASASSRSLFDQILLQIRRGGRCSTTAERKGGTAAAPSSTAAQPRRHPHLYIPNPDTFVCAGWHCAWDTDVLADLRKEWMGSIYKALPIPAISEELLSSTSSPLSLFSSSPPVSPELSSRELQLQRKAALNEALAEELHINRNRRPGRNYSARLTRFCDLDSEGSSLPPLSLPTQQLSASSQAESPPAWSTSATANSRVNTTDSEMQLSRFQQSWVKAAALHLLRDGGDGKEEEGEGSPRPRLPCTSPSASAAAEDNNGPLLSAYCWAVCDACGKLRRVAQPFPGGAPFVCAMAVTASSSSRAVRGGGSPSSSSAAFANTDMVASIENACSVSEVEGLIQCSIKLCEAELITAAMSSPFLPYPLKSQLNSLSVGNEGCGVRETTATGDRFSRADVVRVLLAEPLLRTIQSSVTEAIVDGTRSAPSPSGQAPNSKGHRAGAPVMAPTSASQKNRDAKGANEGDDGVHAASIFLQRSLPILRELARSIKKRGMASMARKIQLTPAQIQAKREAVLRNSLLDGYQTGSNNSSSNNNCSAPVGSAVPVEAEKGKGEMKHEPEEEEATGGEAGVTVVGGLATRPRARGVPAGPPEISCKTATASVTATQSTSAAAIKATCVRRGPSRPSRVKEEAPVEASPAPAKRKRSRPVTPPRTILATGSAEANGRIEAVAVERDDAPDDKRRSHAGRHRGQEEKAAASHVKAEAEALQQTQPRRGVGRPRGRPPAAKKERADKEDERRKAVKHSAAGPENEDEDGGDETWEVVHWVQCDRCAKWRVVPRRVSPRVKFWECKMRYDDERGRATTCDDVDDADLSTK